MEVIVYMGNERLGREDYGKYICVSQFVGNIVNEVYYKYTKDKNIKNWGIDERTK